MLTLLIAMVWDVKRDLRCTKDAMNGRVKESDCIKRNDDIWEDLKAIQKTVWSGNHEK
jgi:hypothetical protein